MFGRGGAPDFGEPDPGPDGCDDDLIVGLVLVLVTADVLGLMVVWLGTVVVGLGRVVVRGTVAVGGGDPPEPPESLDEGTPRPSSPGASAAMNQSLSAPMFSPDGNWKVRLQESLTAMSLKVSGDSGAPASERHKGKVDSSRTAAPELRALATPATDFPGPPSRASNLHSCSFVGPAGFEPATNGL